MPIIFGMHGVVAKGIHPRVYIFAVFECYVAAVLAKSSRTVRKLFKEINSKIQVELKLK